MDNLQDIFFWECAACKTSDGQLIFGGGKGIVMFNPDEITDNTRIPDLYLTSFELFNKPVAIGDYDSLLTQNINAFFLNGSERSKERVIISIVAPA